MQGIKIEQAAVRGACRIGLFACLFVRHVGTLAPSAQDLEKEADARLAVPRPLPLWRRQEGEAATAQPRSIAAVLVACRQEGVLGAQARGSTISFDDEDAANVREEDAFSGVKSELLDQATNGFSGADITKI